MPISVATDNWLTQLSLLRRAYHLWSSKFWSQTQRDVWWKRPSSIPKAVQLYIQFNSTFVDLLNKNKNLWVNGIYPDKENYIALNSSYSISEDKDYERINSEYLI